MAKSLTIKFKNQQFQTDAARAVTDVFRGQRNQSMVEFTLDMGTDSGGFFDVVGFRNQPLTVPADALLTNIRAIQMSAQLKPSETIGVKDLRLTIEMETGTGKTYTYIKTMFELNKFYGWSKFIIVVPSVAIREGVKRSFEIMSELMGKGLPLAELNRVLFRERAKPQVLLMGRALNSLKYYEGSRIAVMKLTRRDFDECGALSEHADTLVNFGLATVGTKMALLAREGTDGAIKFSLRAKEPDSVSDIAQEFGGGGHPQASGITMYGDLDETVSRVLDAMVRKLNG